VFGERGYQDTQGRFAAFDRSIAPALDGRHTPDAPCSPLSV